MSSNNSSSSSSNRNGFIFPDFSLRRLLLQTRTGRAPYTTRMCDVERGASNSNSGVVANGIGNFSNSKHEKTSHGSTLNNGSDVSSGKVSSLFYFHHHCFCFFLLFFSFRLQYFRNRFCSNLHIVHIDWVKIP